MINLTDVYKIVYTRLDKISCNLYDYVPYGLLDFPYVYIGGLYNRDNSVKNNEELSCELYINVISAYRGRKEILDIMNEIINLMNQDMSTNEYSIVAKQGRHTVSQIRDNVGWGKSDNNTFYHAVLIYEINITQKNK